MRVTTRITKKEQKIKKRMDSSNIKKKWFDEAELENYGIPRRDIDIILEYQKRLPILQQENSNWIDCRSLHEQLCIKTKFSDWIKGRIKKYGFSENADFSISEKKETLNRGSTTSIEYSISVSMAKELSMIENNEMGMVARKYFIAIESAYKLREKWNYDRADSLVGYSGLQQSFIKYRPELLETLPDWSKRNIQKADFWAINDCIIGMSTKTYRNIMGLKPKESVRNAFSEQQLEYVSELERFDADLIMVHHIFDFEKRHSLLISKYEEITKCGRVIDSCNT